MPDRAPTTPAHRRFLTEWRRLRYRRDLVGRASTWRLVEGTITDLDELVEAVHHTVRAGEREARLHRLLELAAGDDLAIHILLRALLPDLEHLHRKRRCQGWPNVDFGDLLATGWIVIRTYNPGRRPAKITNSLVSDIDWREYRSALRRKGEHRATAPTEFDRFVATSEPTAFDELFELLRDARAAGVSDTDLDLARQLAAGRRTAELAESLGVTARTIRNRRHRIAASLREVALAA